MSESSEEEETEEEKQKSYISPNKLPDINKKPNKINNNVIIDNDLIDNLTKNLGTNQSTKQENNKKDKDTLKFSSNEEFSGFEFGNTDNTEKPKSNTNINTDPYDIFESSQPQQKNEIKQDNVCSFKSKFSYNFIINSF